MNTPPARIQVDLVVLSRFASPLRSDVQAGIDHQREVDLVVHRLTGSPQAGDRNRLETIVRARNQASGHGVASFVLLLDDDVVLGAGCVVRLVTALVDRPGFAALAADSAGEMQNAFASWDYPRHVSMAAVLFRRPALERVRFRWEDTQCECRCCSIDLRQQGLAIGYLREAGAWHRPHQALPAPAPEPQGPPPVSAPSAHAAPTADRHSPPRGHVLAAFDRRHLRHFRRLFLQTLRDAGNPESVTALGYGLRPSEHASLARVPGVRVVARPRRDHPAQAKLADFQHLCAQLPEHTPVAYWDAGDVIFQDRLTELWRLVAANPDHLLVAQEHSLYRDSPVNMSWVQTIRDPSARRRAIELLIDLPILNSGFAAATARTMLAYLREADRILHSPALAGSTDWGDQMALNLYCYGDPRRYREVSRAWNYCLVFRGADDFRVNDQGRVASCDDQPIHVVHCNGRTLRLRVFSQLART